MPLTALRVQNGADTAKTARAPRVYISGRYAADFVAVGQQEHPAARGETAIAWAVAGWLRGEQQLALRLALDYEAVVASTKRSTFAAVCTPACANSQK